MKECLSNEFAGLRALRLLLFVMVCFTVMWLLFATNIWRWNDDFLSIDDMTADGFGRSRNEHNINANTSECMRVIIGIASHEERRQQNWRILLRMQRDLPQDLKCGLNFALVSHAQTNNTGDGRESEAERIIEWFRHASHTYPHAHVIASMRDDTAIHLRRLEIELSAALEHRADYMGDPISDDGLFYMSSAFYAMSQKLTSLVLLAYDQYGVEYRNDTAKSIGKLIQQSGVNTACCLQNGIPSSHASYASCSIKCHLLSVKTSTDADAKHATGNIQLNSQFSFAANEGDSASMRFLGKLPYLVWGFWFGPPMAGARLAGYQQLIKNIGLPFQLVTFDDLYKYNLSFSPMHPLIGQRGLSAAHTGDYLRVYFMHHYGGGYHDIKPHSKSWKQSFAEFEKDENIWLLGVPECPVHCVGCDDSNLVWCPNRTLASMYTLAGSRSNRCCGEVSKAWHKLVSNGAYIMRPGTLITAMWLDLVEAHMTAKMEKVLMHPAQCPRRCKDDLYPFRWTELHGEAFHPVQYLYTDHIKRNLPRWGGGPYQGPNENTMDSNDGRPWWSYLQHTNKSPPKIDL